MIIRDVVQVRTEYRLTFTCAAFALEDRLRDKPHHEAMRTIRKCAARTFRGSWQYRPPMYHVEGVRRDRLRAMMDAGLPL